MQSVLKLGILLLFVVSTFKGLIACPYIPHSPESLLYQLLEQDLEKASPEEKSAYQRLFDEERQPRIILQLQVEHLISPLSLQVLLEQLIIPFLQAKGASDDAINAQIVELQHFYYQLGHKNSLVYQLIRPYRDLASGIYPTDTLSNIARIDKAIRQSGLTRLSISHAIDINFNCVFPNSSHFPYPNFQIPLPHAHTTDYTFNLWLHVMRENLTHKDFHKHFEQYDLEASGKESVAFSLVILALFDLYELNRIVAANLIDDYHRIVAFLTPYPLEPKGFESP